MAEVELSITSAAASPSASGASASGPTVEFTVRQCPSSAQPAGATASGPTVEFSIRGAPADIIEQVAYWTMSFGGVAERYVDGVFDSTVTAPLTSGDHGYGLAIVGDEGWTLHYGYDPDYEPGIIRFALSDGTVAEDVRWSDTSWFPDWIAWDGSTMWVAEVVNAQTEVGIYTVDLSTGAKTLECTLGAPPDIVSGASDLWGTGMHWVSGELWIPSGIAAATSGSRYGLNRINTSTGAIAETVTLLDEYSSGQRLQVSGLAHDGTNWLVGSSNGSETKTVVVDSSGALVEVHDRNTSASASGMDVE